MTGSARGRGSSGQDLGEGIWPVLSVFLPRTAQILVSPHPILALRRGLLAICGLHIGTACAAVCVLHGEG